MQHPNKGGRTLGFLFLKVFFFTSDDETELFEKGIEA